MGSDAVGRFGDYPEQIRIYGQLFDALVDKTVVEKLARSNFLRVMRHDGVVLDRHYQYPEDNYTGRPLTPR